jgi:mRNA interferase HigB
MYTLFVNLIAPRTLRNFYEEHAEAETVMKAWQKQIQGKDYATWQMLKQTFPAADLVTAKADIPVVVFSVGGNNYRIIARVSYLWKTIHIKWNKKGKPL